MGNIKMDDDCDCGDVDCNCCDGCCDNCAPPNCCPDEAPTCCDTPDCCGTPDCKCCDCCDTNNQSSSSNTTYYIFCFDTPSCDPCCWDYERKKRKESRPTNNVTAFKSNPVTNNAKKDSGVPPVEYMQRDEPTTKSDSKDKQQTNPNSLVLT